MGTYPIIRLDLPQDLLDHMKRLESAVISFLQHYHLPAQRDPPILEWLGTPNASPLKVCSIGIACRQWVTWHGLALNWSMDLGYFQYLDPCGFGATIMTRVTDWRQPSRYSRRTATLLYLSRNRVVSSRPHISSF